MIEDNIGLISWGLVAIAVILVVLAVKFLRYKGPK